MYSYDTVSEAVDGLRKRGFLLDFNLAENCLICDNEKFKAGDFRIIEVYRFEGNSDPGDEAVVYAISSHGEKKGVLVTGYGVSAEGLSADMAAILDIKSTRKQ
jgi:hypothetical protein